MKDWNPDLYRRFEEERTRPARDLLAVVPLTEAARVVDLGCGPGNSTELLAARYPGAEVTGLDTSPAMVEAARKRLPDCRFELADASSWTPSEAPDLIFANAVLQWVPDHQTLLPRLLSLVAPGGALAIQMPDNLDEPSHRLMREVAADGPWRETIGDAAALRIRLPALADYYDLLAGQGATVDVWRTAYQHRMESPKAIVDWLRSTGLRPFVDKLSEDERQAFLQRYEAAIDKAYPERADGSQLLAFPRIFIVARRAASRGVSA